MSVSEYEYTSNSRKNFSKEEINETFNIVKNGSPIYTRCGKVVAASMKEYFQDKQPHMTTKELFKKSKTLLKSSN